MVVKIGRRHLECYWMGVLRRLEGLLGLVVIWVLVMGLPVAQAADDDELGGAESTAAEFAAQVKTGVMRIPFMATPPKLDGRLEPGEWENSAACYGSWQCYVHDWQPYIAVEEKQPVWYLAYDKDYLYVAHSSPVFPKASWLLNRGKYHDVMMHEEYGILWDDNIQFSIIPSDKDGSFFKWMCNPINTYVDLYRDMGGTAELDYGYRGLDLEGRFDEDSWVTEWRIPLASLKFGTYDGKDPERTITLPLRDGTVWQVGMARSIGGTADGSKLFSNRGNTWSTNSAQKMVFDSQGVSAQVSSFGRLLRDSANLNVMLKNHGKQSETVRVGFYIENDTELILANEEEKYVELLPGEVKRIQLKQDKIGITPRSNAVWVDIRTISGKIVYRDVLMNFHSIEGWPRYQEKFVDGMKYTRPARKPFAYKYIYYPSVNKLRATVDTDIFGTNDATKTAVEARVKLLSVDTGKEVAVMRIALETPVANALAQTFGGRMGDGIMSFDKLAPGEYKTVCLLYDADKRIVGDAESGIFKQNSYPWEGSTEGLEDIVWQPYTPLEWATKERELKTLMHDFKLDSTGLPTQISIKGKNPAYGPQLRAPLRVETTAGGKRSLFSGSGELERVKDWKSEQVFAATGSAGPVKIRGQALYDCDGTLTYDLWYQSGSAPIDTLELVMDLAGPVDTLGWRGTDWHVRGDEVLKREGSVVWNSRDDMKPRELYYGNFIPALQIGDGDRCFIWACETDRGMKLLADKPAMQVERNEKGEYTLRVFLVNEPGPVGEERHVQFALMTQPDRPKPAGSRKTAWGEEVNLIAAGMGGFAIGDGSSNYTFHLTHEEDYEKFWPLYKHKHNRPYTCTGAGLAAMPCLSDGCYTGEIAGGMGVPEARKIPDGMRTKVTGRPIETILDESDRGLRWVPSMVDCQVYWRSKQIRQVFVHGFFFDNGFIGQNDHDPVVGNAYYLPEHKSHAAGHLQSAFSLMLPRQLFKRLARISAKAGIDCDSNANTSVGPPLFAGSYFRDALMVEGTGSFIQSAERPHFLFWTPAESRYFSEPYSGRIAYYACNIGPRKLGAGKPIFPGSGDDPMNDRSLLTSALLHDAGVLQRSHANTYPWVNVRRALEEFGYLEEDESSVEYIPYWRSASFYQYGYGTVQKEDEFASEEDQDLSGRIQEVYCTIYKNARTGKAMLVLANHSAKPIAQNLVLKDTLLGRTAKKLTDVEVNQEIESAKDPKTNKDIPNLYLPVHILPWQFRLLVAE
ncbi:MAG: hypothetical protein HQL31_04940 [Planctomycetes bacterium]|nr:hypothetical protein [Planctomycetota bacterium]